MKKAILLVTAAMVFMSCQQPKQEKTTQDYTPAFKIENCDKTLGGIHFTKMMNGADSYVAEKDSIITFSATEGTDLFIDPDGGKLTRTTARILFTEVDNTKPFTFSARMQPEFNKDGLYNQANLVVMANDTLWQKFCFEQDERGKHRVVTVRTVGTSDDNNHEVINQEFVYFKISSDTHTIASYYSLDGKEWQMVRLYKNSYPKILLLGFSSLAPQKGTCVSLFSDMELSTDNVSDFRLGN